jgi:hypothetical protein
MRGEEWHHLLEGEPRAEGRNPLFGVNTYCAEVLKRDEPLYFLVSYLSAAEEHCEDARRRSTSTAQDCCLHRLRAACAPGGRPRGRLIGHLQVWSDETEARACRQRCVTSCIDAGEV